MNSVASVVARFCVHAIQAGSVVEVTFVEKAAKPHLNSYSDVCNFGYYDFEVFWQSLNRP